MYMHVCHAFFIMCWSSLPPLLTAHTHTHTQYLSLMKELGESVPGGAPTNPQVSNKPSQAGVGVGTNVPPPMALVRKTQSCDSHVTCT